MPESNKPQIAMLGRSNVGKSSLINHLAGLKGLARTSAKPGLTQTINVYEFYGRYHLVDLPGYGFSRKARSKGEGFERMLGDYLSDAELLKLVLLVIDGRHGLTERDQHVLDTLLEQKIPFVIVLNKIDKVSNSAAAMALTKIKTAHPEIRLIPHSIVTGKGLGEIREAIETVVRAEKEAR